MDDYIILADIPKIHMESEEEFQGLRRRNQSPSPRRDQRLKTPRLVVLYGLVWCAVSRICQCCSCSTLLMYDFSSILSWSITITQQ